MPSSVLCLCACFILIQNSIDAARILAVFPTPSISHQVVFRPFTQELAKRGHEVTVITTDPAFPEGEAPANLTEIDTHDISYKVFLESFMGQSKGRKDDMHSHIKLFMGNIVGLVDGLLKSPNVKKLMTDQSKQFDLIITEACIRPALAFSHIYKAPVIQMSSLGAVWDNYQTVGAPTHPLLYPAAFRQKLYNLTLWDTISELYVHYVTQWYLYKNQEAENAMLQEHFGPSIPSVAELTNNIHMLFLNIHPIFEGIRPVPPNVIYLGGLHQKPEKPLPADLKAFLDSSKRGVIYISFGTNVDPTLLPADRIEVLVKTLSQMPYDVLWKWNGDELPGRTENIRISKWLPQADLLRHPNVKVFITQGGLQSTDEAITAGVPLVGVPMFTDQWFNVEKYKYLKIGVGVDMETLTVETFTNAINAVIGNESYRQNIVKLGNIIRDSIQTPLERAVWWTEYVLRHGGARHLRDPAANISWYQYLELELVAVILAVCLITIAIIVTLAYLLIKKILSVFVAPVKIKRS